MTGAPRLGVVTNDFPPKPGGIQQYLGSLVDAYPGEVVVVAPADGPAATTARVVRHRRRYLWPTPRVVDWVAGELANASVEAVLFGAPWPLTAMTGPLRRRVDVPTAVIGHGAEVTVPAAVPGLRRALRRALVAPDLRFAVSRFTGARIERLTGRPVHHLGAGVDLDRFVPGRSPDRAPPVVGCVSRFVPRKGQRRVIDAVAELAGRVVPVEVTLAGKGRQERRLRRRAAELGFPVRFEVDVPWEALPSLYRGFDVFAMPCQSRWFGLEVEGLGLVFLEAAACGLPVVAGDSGGSAETVDDGETGFVVRDRFELVDALAALLEDPALRHRMGTAGRARVEAEFTWPTVVGRLLAGFADVT